MQYATLVGILAAIVWVTLPFFYWATAPDWHLTKTGRALMWLLGSTAGLFTLLLTSRIFGDYAGKPFVHAAVYAATLYAAVRLAVLFVELRVELAKLVKREDAERVAAKRREVGH